MKPGDIVLVKFPFSDLESSKRRPALVLVRSDLTTRVGLVTIAMITSKIEGLKLAGDYLIQNWQEARLLHASLIRLAKIATVELDLVDKNLGRLTNADLKRLQQVFRKQFKFWLQP
jgi:mRNA interferase MazF